MISFHSQMEIKAGKNERTHDKVISIQINKTKEVFHDEVILHFNNKK